MSLCITAGGAFPLLKPRRTTIANVARTVTDRISQKRNASIDFYPVAIVPANVDIDLQAKRINIKYTVVYNEYPIPKSSNNCESLINDAMRETFNVSINAYNDPMLYSYLAFDSVTNPTSVKDISIVEITRAVHSQINTNIGSSIDGEDINQLQTDVVSEILQKYNGLVPEDEQITSELSYEEAQELYMLITDPSTLEIPVSATGFLELCYGVTVDGTVSTIAPRVINVHVDADGKYIEYTLQTSWGLGTYRLPLPDENITQLEIPIASDSTQVALLQFGQKEGNLTKEEAKLVHVFKLIDDYLDGKEVKDKINGIELNIPAKKEGRFSDFVMNMSKSKSPCATELEALISAWTAVREATPLTVPAKFWTFLTAFLNYIKCIFSLCAAYPIVSVSSLFAIFFGFFSQLSGMTLLCMFRKWYDLIFILMDFFEAMAFQNCALLESAGVRFKEYLKQFTCAEGSSVILDYMNGIADVFIFVGRLFCTNIILLIFSCLIKIIRNIVLYFITLFIRFLMVWCCGISNTKWFDPKQLLFGCKPDTDCPQ